MRGHFLSSKGESDDAGAKFFFVLLLTCLSSLAFPHGEDELRMRNNGVRVRMNRIMSYFI